MASDSASFSTGIWSAVKSLSRFDTISYLLRCDAILEPGIGIPLFSANPHSYNLTALHAVLLLHRYSFGNSPDDISKASNLMLDSISLVDEPGYQRFFFLLACRSIHLFEYTTELPHLDLGIELLERFSAVQEPGTSMHVVVAMVHACACLQYSLKQDVGEALDDARKIVKEACQASSQSPWVSAFGDTRTKVILADLIQSRDDMVVAGEDFEPTVHAGLRLLDSLAPSPDCQYTAMQILVISVISFLSQTADPEGWLGALGALTCVLHGQSNTIQLSMQKSLPLLSDAINRCSSARAMCLIYMADILDVEIVDQPGPLEDMISQVAWTNEWESAQRFLQHRIKTFEEKNYGIDVTSTPSFLKFKIHGDVLHRSSLSNVRFREVPPLGTHVCIFKFVTIPASNCQDGLHNSEISGAFTHYNFFGHLQRLCDTASPHELKFLSDHPDEIDQLFKRSKYLDNTDSAEAIAAWKKSPGVIGYLLTQTGQEGVVIKRKAARHMLKVDYDREPGYIPFLHRLAGDLRDYETDPEAVGMSSKLIKEFLRVQKRGTAMHFIGVMELATNHLIEFLSRSKAIALLAVALELFREAVESRGDDPWIIEARKVVVLGRILHHRLKYFAESEASLTQTINHFTILWDALPVGRPFSVSALELIATATLLNLSRRLEFEEWIDGLKLLSAGLDLYINGTEVEDSELDGLDSVKNNGSLLELVLDGINVGSFNLASKALCLFHVSDMLRSIALDICRNPGFLGLSAEMYRRSLDHQFEDSHRNEDNLQSRWNREMEGFIEALTSIARPQSIGTSPPGFGGVPLSIFRYRAARPTSRNQSRSFSHNCVLRYHPTKVSSLSEVLQESPPISPVSEGSSTPDMPHLPPWPSDLMALPPALENNLGTRSVLHTTMFPGIETVIHDERHEFFRMPLETRTIKALMRSIEDDVRETEFDFSHISERIVHQFSEPVYWAPKDVQLGNRIAKMKSGSSPYLARIAPLQALLSRGPEQCLALIESSRALFWTRLLRLHTTFEGLPEDLARQLEDTAHELDSCKSQSVASVSKEDMQLQFELESEFSHLLGKARKIPGFENLLKPKAPEELLEASVGGPVIILMGELTYAALVVTTKGVNSVLLPELTSNTLEGLQRGLNRENAFARGNLQEQDDGEPEKARGGRPRDRPQVASYESFLSTLWDLVVKPIFEFMGLLSPVSMLSNPRPRLWWCPTARFTFLPLHAAGRGFGTENMESVSKYVVSSYTPTLSALISARSKMTQASRIPVSDLRSLVLAQPTTEGYANLPNTLKELALVESLTPASQLLQIGSGPLTSSNANKTVEEAVQYLEQASILHLACHGHQDRADPLNSGFELTDGRLTVAKLISCHPQKAFLAFLSACESAANDLEVPDESLNLSAAMLYAGFSSVIGTLWSMNDNDGPLIARSIYEELFKNPTAPLDPKIIPYALDLAIQKLQRNGVQPSRWATYIHVGI